MESLYRKYRPQTFQDVVGQSHVVATLERAVTEGRTSHAYLFCGPRGTGKTTMARILAKALECEQGPGHLPDGTCEECRLIAAGEHPDVYELDAASRTGVDNVREEIINRVDYAPVRGRYKVYIIDEVHMLTPAAFNALLKTLEEPPAHVVFIMCTTDPQKILATILSRVQRFDFRPIANDEMRAHLADICDKEGFTYEDEALDLVVRHARGGMRDAISTLEQLSVFGDGSITAEAARDLLGETSTSRMAEVSRALAARDVPALFAEVASLADSGADLLQFTRELAARVRDVYVVAVAGARPGVVSADANELAELKKEAETYGGTDRLARALEVLGDAAAEMRFSSNQRLVLEIALTKAARPTTDLTLASLAERVETLERQLASGAVVAALVPVAPASTVPPTVPAPSAGAPTPASAPSAAPVPAPNSAPVPASAPAASVPTATGRPVPPPNPLRHRATASAPAVAPTPVPAPAPATPVRVAPPTPVPAPVAPTAPAPITSAAPAPVATASATRVAPAAPAPAAPASAISAPTESASAAAGDLQRSWKAVVDGLLKSNASCGSLLLNARAASDDGSVLAVELPGGSSFTRRMLEREDVKAIVGATVEAVFGPRTVRFTVAGEGGSSPAASAAQVPAAAPVPSAPAPHAPTSPAIESPAPAPAPSAPAPESPTPAPKPAPIAPPRPESHAPKPSAPVVHAPSAPEPDPDEPSYDDVPYDEASYDEECMVLSEDAPSAPPVTPMSSTPVPPRAASLQVPPVAAAQAREKAEYLAQVSNSPENGPLPAPASSAAPAPLPADPPAATPAAATAPAPSPADPPAATPAAATAPAPSPAVAPAAATAPASPVAAPAPAPAAAPAAADAAPQSAEELASMFKDVFGRTKMTRVDENGNPIE